MSDSEIVGILLAAGKSTRFGSDKLLHPLADGTPMAVLAARSLRQACPRCVAVLRPQQRDLAILLEAEGLDVHFSVDAEAGMGHSLAAAVHAAQQAAGWVVALADMPLVRAATIGAIAAALRDGAPLAAPWFQGRRGHPVGFSARWREPLAALTGDQGARSLLARHPDAVTRIICNDPGVLVDFDTQAALQGISGCGG